jgi:predicted ATP-grasp superfamily ATP-dependent carboligase
MGAMQPPDQQTAKFGASRGPLILLGASVRAATVSAARAGFRVTAIDLFGDVDTRAACKNYVPLNKSTLSVVQKLHGEDSATRLMIVGGLDQHAELAGALAAEHPRLGTNADALEHLATPECVREIARQSGLSFPPIRAHRRAKTPSTDRWLWKNPHSSGGLAVRWTRPARRRTGATDHFYQQNWVPGRPHGATFLSNGSACRLLGICAGRFTRIGQSPFVYAGSLGPQIVTTQVRSMISNVGQTIVNRTSIAGIFNADLMIHSDHIWLLEVNARWSASCELVERWLIDTKYLGDHESLLGMAYQTLESELASIPEPDHAVPPHQYLKRIVFSRREGCFDSQRIPRQSNRQVDYADLPSQGHLIRRHDPILTMIIRGRAGEAFPWQHTRRLIAQVQQAVV